MASQHIQADIRQLSKGANGYDVFVALQLAGTNVEIAIPTSEADPSRAVESARQWLYKLGVDLASTFQSAGSLK